MFLAWNGATIGDGPGVKKGRQHACEIQAARRRLDASARREMLPASRATLNLWKLRVDEKQVRGLARFLRREFPVPFARFIRHYSAAGRQNMANKSTDDASEGALTRTALRDAAYRACLSISRTEARQIVDATLEEIAEALLRGETVKLHSFGIFKVRSKGERIGRNPKTCAEAVITARRVITFKPSRELMAYVTRHAREAKAGKAENEN
jgi:integration host factor subunit alpha